MVKPSTAQATTFGPRIYIAWLLGFCYQDGARAGNLGRGMGAIILLVRLLSRIDDLVRVI